MTYGVMSAPLGLHALDSRLIALPSREDRTTQVPLDPSGITGLTLVKKSTASDLLGSLRLIQYSIVAKYCHMLPVYRICTA